MGYDGYGGWRPYKSVAKRRREAARKVAALKKKGRDVDPVSIEGRKIARTFWGKAWCDNLESYSDYANRLPRGRTYVRNGSVIDLRINRGEVRALVSGSSIYEVAIRIRGGRERSVARPDRQVRGKYRLGGRAARRQVLQRGDGDPRAPGHGSLPCARRDHAHLLLSRLGDHVQARCGRAVWDWSTARSCTPRCCSSCATLITWTLSPTPAAPGLWPRSREPRRDRSWTRATCPTSSESISMKSFHRARPTPRKNRNAAAANPARGPEGRRSGQGRAPRQRMPLRNGRRNHLPPRARGARDRVRGARIAERQGRGVRSV